MILGHHHRKNPRHVHRAQCRARFNPGPIARINPFLLVDHRAVHREEFGEAAQLLDTARQAAVAMKADIAAHPECTTPATRRLTERTDRSVLRVRHCAGQAHPTPEEIEIDEAAYLNGLAEAASELRRRALDLIRRDRVAEAERMLTAMDDIYASSHDRFSRCAHRRTAPHHRYPRAVLERTRGDLTTTLQQEKLQKALQEMEKRL